MQRCKLEQTAAEDQLEKCSRDSKDEKKKYTLALEHSKMKCTTMEKEYQQVMRKFTQMKQMLQHLADANGQVARVYGALGTRLTEVRAEQAAARGCLEATKEDLVFLQSRIQEGSQQQLVDKAVLAEKDATLVERGRRLKGLQEEVVQNKHDRKIMLQKQQQQSNDLKVYVTQKTVDDKNIIRSSAELVQTRNTIRKIQNQAVKYTTEIASMKNERVGLCTEIQGLKDAAAAVELACIELRTENDATARKALTHRTNMIEASNTIEVLKKEKMIFVAEIAELKNAAQDVLSSAQMKEDQTERLARKYQLAEEDHVTEKTAMEKKLKDTRRMNDTLQKERMDMLEEMQHKNEKSSHDVRSMRSEAEQWKKHADVCERNMHKEQERADAMQKLASALKAMSQEHERKAMQQEQHSKRTQQELFLAERAAQSAREEADAVHVSLVQQEERATRTILAAERSAQIAREEAEAAQTRASRQSIELLNMSRTSSGSSRRAENYPLGFHLGKFEPMI